MSFYIGNIEIKGRVILAPMAGITSFSYRKFMSKLGTSLVYSEMISDCGLIYGNKETKNLLYTDNKESPFAIQLFGGSKDTLVKAIDILENLNINYDILDINLACPVNKVIKGHAGSYWLTDLNNLYDLMREITKVSYKPVSCKIRLGFNDINVNDVTKLLENAGVKFIAIHARTRKEMYSGLPHFEYLKDLAKNINIPFAVSGNIFTVKDGLNALNITNATALMVARGAIGNPNLITNLNKALNKENYDESINLDEQIEYLKEYSRLLIKEKGEDRAISVLKGIAPKFFKDFPNSKFIRKEITLNCRSYRDLLNILDKIKTLNPISN